MLRIAAETPVFPPPLAQLSLVNLRDVFSFLFLSLQIIEA